MTTDEFKSIIFDLHKENREEILAIRKDLNDLKTNFKTHEASVKMIASLAGIIGGGIFTILLTMFRQYL